MRKMAFWCFVLLITGSGEARAERTSTRITPEKPGDSRWTFLVKVVRSKRDGKPDTLAFTVSVTPVKPKELRLPDRVTTLEVRDGTTDISDSRLEPKTVNDVSTYTFQVSEPFIAKSRLMFGETDERLPLDGMGAYYWFHLGDFVTAPKAPADGEPAKTPFDGDPKLAKEYRQSFALGRQWANSVHLVCPTNPSEFNRHAIRGWVDGWLAGVKSGGESSLPAKYAPFLAWTENKPVENPEERWDVSKFPKLTGKVATEMGHANSYVPPEKGDGFTLDFAAIAKLQRLAFDRRKDRDPYLSVYGPLKLVRVNTFTTGALSNCRFTSQGNNEALHIDVQPKPGRGDKRFVEVFVTVERNGLVHHAVVLETLADGVFPDPRPTGK